MRKPLAIIILMYFFLMPCVLAIGETDVYQIEDGKDDVIMTETLALDTDGPYIILKDYDVSYKIGLRFTNINISRGETITEAILSVYCKYDFPNGTGTVTIYGLKVADAPVLDDPEDLSGPLTDSYVIWNISNVKGPNKWHNVTITPIIQEIVNQYGWESGNSLALIILSEKGNIRRQFTSADYMNPAKLYITITPPTPPGANYELIKTYKGYEIYNVSISQSAIENFSSGDWILYKAEDRYINIYDDYYVRYQLSGGPSSAKAWHYKEYSPPFDDFKIEFYYNVTYSADTSETLVPILTLSNQTASTLYYLDSHNIDYLSIIEWWFPSDDKVGLRIKYRNYDTTYFSGYYKLDLNTKYKIILEKNDLNVTITVSYLNGTIINPSWGNPYLTLAEDEKYTVLYFPHSQAHPSYDAWDMIGYIWNLDTGRGSSYSDWWIEIWYNGTQVNGNFTSVDDAIDYIDNVIYGPEEEPYNPEVGGYEVIPRRYVKLGFLMSGLGLMMVGLIAISYKPTLGRAIMGILMIVLAMGLLIHLTQI